MMLVEIENGKIVFVDVLGNGELRPMYEVVPPDGWQEVKHGKWIKMDSGCARWSCSVCGAENNFAYCRGEYDEFELQDKFCPNCGARMDGETDASV